ncbi:branched-chain amino acid ABC transporter permease [Rhodoferax lacus]|nr:branched-chain amino acid ABC transporter permease [Rhodoferax lacus]
MEFFSANQSVFDFFLLTLGFSYSQQVVLRSGVFSLASAAFAALGSYGCAYLVMRAGLPVLPGLLLGALIGAAAGYLTSIPLARLRGVYQAIATLALVEVTVAVALYAEPITGGAVGFNGIPKLVGTQELLLAIFVVGYVLYAMGHSRIGRGFDALRQDEFVAASLGVSSRRQHTLAFIASGLIGGLFGALQSMYSYSIEPHQFGFGFMVSTLAAIVLGGRRTLLGPVVGSAIVILLPEIARPLAEYRQIVVGAVLVIVVIYTPQGLADTFIAWLSHRKNDMKATTASADTTGGRHGNA